MIVRIQMAVIVLLMAAVGYGALTYQSKVGALEDKVRRLEAAAARMQSECESRIAAMKAGGTAGAKDFAVSTKGPLAGIVNKLPVNPDKARLNTLAEMKENLAMESSQVSATERVLHEFHLERSRAVSEASKGNGFPFGPETVRAVDKARKDSMDKLKTVLTEEQYRGMVEKGYDQRLGLRAAVQ